MVQFHLALLAHLAHLAAVQGKSLRPLLHLVASMLPLGVVQRARSPVAEVDRAGDLLQGQQGARGAGREFVKKSLFFCITITLI